MFFPCPVAQFEGMTQAEWFATLDTVELSNPGQSLSAAYITAKFARGAGAEEGNGTGKF